MNTNEFKTIKISPELHNKLKKYCKDNDFKLNSWIQKQLEKIINSLDEKKNN